MHLLFPGQQDTEEIILVVRKHWFYLFSKILVWLMFVAVLFLFDYFGPEILPGLFEGQVTTYVNLVKNVYTTLLVLGLFMIWVLWYLNLWVITNKRVVDIDQVSIFHQRISELTFPNIEDITSETKGVLGTFLGYGSVQIQTAGETERFEVSSVPNPKTIERLIYNLMEKSEHSHPHTHEQP